MKRTYSMQNSIVCPECKKIVGQYIFIDATALPGLGSVGHYDMKYDHRKVSGISLGRGFLCKGCAKKYFTNGYACKVTINYHGKRISPYVGIGRSGWFSEETEAQKAADELNRKCYDNFARYEKQTI